MDSSDKNIKVNNWDGSAVKNALDDAVKEVLTKNYKYTENFALMDGRLALSGIAVGASIFALVWDYLYPFPESRPVLIFCISTYFFFMGILTYYTTYKEKGIFFTAIERDSSGFNPDNRLEVSSYLKKYDDKYHLVLNFYDGKSKSNREATLIKSVACFFTDKGELLIDLLKPEVTKLHNSLLNAKKEK